MSHHTVCPSTLAQLVRRSLVRPPAPWNDSEPDLIVGHSGAFFGRDHIHPSVLNHVLVTGGTGCGKSQSVVMPLLSSMVAYRNADGDHASMLVIDPKRELEAVTLAQLESQGETHRLLKLGECPPVRFFGANCSLSPTERVSKLIALLPDYEERGPWKALGLRLLGYAVTSEHIVLKAGIGRLHSVLMSCIDSEAGKTPLSFWQALRDLLDFARSDRNRLMQLISVLEEVEKTWGLKLPLTTFFKGYSAAPDLIEQWNYVCMSVDPYLLTLASDDILTVVDVDPYPDMNSPCTDLAAALDTGKVLLFQPTPRPTDAITAKVLKSSVYGGAFARANLRRPMFIVIDEAQRFVTSDPDHGEEVFLDACRAYRVNVVMATQSIASLRYALGQGARSAAALDILCTNTPTKFVMRSTDTQTQQMLQALLPPPDFPGERHVAVERPPSGLRPGEAYWMWSDGTWGRSRARLAELIPAASTAALVGVELPLTA